MSESTIVYFDAYALIHQRFNKHPQMQWSLTHLLDQMETVSVSGALVQSTQSVVASPMRANYELCDQLYSHDNLYSVWGLMPGQWDECPDNTELISLLNGYGVRAVTLSPASNEWMLRAAPTQPFLRTLAESGRPVLLKASELANYGDLEWLLAEYPQWQVILTGAFWSEQRKVLPLLAHYENLNVTFDRLQMHFGIEELVEKGYEDRLLFGSGSPEMSMGAHRYYIDYAGITQEAKQKIAGGNLARLLCVELPKARQANDTDDAYITAAKAGAPLPSPVIDFHIHAFGDDTHGGGGAHRAYRGDAKGLKASFDRLGIVSAGIMSWYGPASCDAVAGNRSLFQAMEQLPETYWGAPTFDPTHYDHAAMMAQIKQVYANPQMIGMKPYPRYGLWYDDPLYDPWWQFGQERNYYALLHINGHNFKQVDNLASRYPGVRWVIAHCGSSYPFADSAIEQANKHANVYLEITYTSVCAGIIEYLVAGAGADRVLYGSDAAMRDPRQQLGWVVYSDLDVTAKQKILFDNALRVLEPSAKQWTGHAELARLASPCAL